MRISVYVGLNICDLKSHTMVGRSVQYGLSDDGLILGVDDTFRKLPEKDLHPRKFAERLTHDIFRSADHWNLHITTNCMITLNIIGQLIEDGKISHDAVEIFILDDENKKVTETPSFDEQGYLVGWPADFFCY